MSKNPSVKHHNTNLHLHMRDGDVIRLTGIPYEAARRLINRWRDGFNDTVTLTSSSLDRPVVLNLQDIRKIRRPDNG